MLGERLSTVRLSATPHLSQRELSRLAGLSSEGHVEGIESGRTKSPTVETVLALAGVLGCTVEWLVAGRGKQPTASVVTMSVAKARKAGDGPKAA